ncbi:hypothetical protein LCGC14_1995430, partial [marine sediment metagenome]
WVGVVVSHNEQGHIQAIEMAYNKRAGELTGVDAQAFFHVDRPGQRVLLTDPMKAAISEAKRVLP